ncbi:MAG: 6-bladed beta-propeller [Candidatus Cloacimonetes bacterium]|nr:6-bladed beta-propeller [Candidatus Cloacimonadota bacterium]
MAKKITYLFVILALCSCSKQDRLSEKELNVTFEKIGEIRENENNLMDITDYSVHNDEIYVLDNDEGKIFHYNVKGKLLNTFGNKGKGPGEFILPMNISCLKDRIVIFDYDKRSIIEYSNDGNFIKEWIIGKDNCIQRRLILTQNGKIIGYNRTLSLENSKYNRRETISKFDQNLNIVEDIYIINESAYDPFNMDPFSSTQYALDPENKRIAIAKKSYDYVDFFVMNTEGELLYSKQFQVTLVNLSDKSIADHKRSYEEYKRQYPNYTFTFAEIPKYRRSISSLDFDDMGNLWICTPIDDLAQQKMIIFSDKGDYLGYTTLNVLNVKIENGYIFTRQKDQEKENGESVILIYKIKWLDT